VDHSLDVRFAPAVVAGVVDNVLAIETAAQFHTGDGVLLKLPASHRGRGNIRIIELRVRWCRKAGSAFRVEAEFRRVVGTPCDAGGAGAVLGRLAA
jgi:hypothetical protein